MTLRLSDDERKIVLATLKARLDDVQAEMTHTDNPQFSIRLKDEEKVIQTLIERLESTVPRRPHKTPRSRRRSRPGKRQR